MLYHVWHRCSRYQYAFRLFPALDGAGTAGDVRDDGDFFEGFFSVFFAGK